jgi:molybdopterin converting factor small subunit
VVRYYAVFREQRGLSQETVETAAPTAAALYEELRARHGFTLDGAMVRAAVNRAFRPLDTPLANADEVVFIPPVAGG